MKSAELALILSLGACGPGLDPFRDATPPRTPKLALLTPARAGEAADALYTIDAAFDEVAEGDSWSVFYMSDATATKGAAACVDVPIATRSILWDTTGLPGGTYYLFAKLRSFGGLVTATAPGSLVIEHGGGVGLAGSHGPTVRLLTLNGGETVLAGSTVTVAFTGNDAEGDRLTYALDISSDDGATWAVLATGLTQTTYDWAVPAEQMRGFAYKIRVTAADTKGSTAVDASDQAFHVP